jgi:uncharacterized membrane protein YtjA (UPF0391 family)
MHKSLLIACIALIGAFLGKAGIAPFYETGVARYSTPFVCVAMAFLVALFTARKRWTWRYVRWTVIVFPMLSIVFPPRAEFLGALTRAGQAIALVEGASCLVILVFLLRSDTKSWFFEISAK